MTFFGAVALTLFLALSGEPDGARTLIRPIIVAYAVSAVLLTPYIYYVLARGEPPQFILLRNIQPTC